MRNVVNGSMVAHRWAHGNVGRTGTDNFRTDGVTVWSYATPIAARHVAADGATVFLVSHETYSNATVKHLSHVRRATFGPYVFGVACVTYTERAGRGIRAASADDMHAINLADLVARARDAWASALRARTYARTHAEQAQRLARMARVYATAFLTWGIADVRFSAAIEAARVDRDTFDAWLAGEPAWSDAFRAHVAANVARPYQPRAYQPRAYRALAPLTPAEWRAGKGTTCRHDTIMLRAHGTAVQTSLGASVPMAQARALYDAWTSGRNVVGAVIGTFRVLAQDANALTIGCHYLTRAECDAFAQAQGWTSATVAA